MKHILAVKWQTITLRLTRMDPLWASSIITGGGPGFVTENILRMQTLKLKIFSEKYTFLVGKKI